MLALAANIDRNMLKARVTLENISLALLNLIHNSKIHICHVQSLSPPMFTQFTFIFSLQFTDYGCFSPQLLFPCLTCLVSVSVCILFWEEFIYVTFEIALVFAILTIAPLISESLLGNAPVNGNSLKVSGHLFTFLYLILILIVPDVNLPQIHVSTYLQND